MRTASLSLCFAALISAAAHAQDIQWTNVSGGNYWDGNNWQGGSPPTNIQQAVFAIGGTYTVTGTPAQLYQVRILGGDVTMNVGFAVHSLVVGSPTSPWTIARMGMPNRYEPNSMFFNIQVSNGTITSPISCEQCSVGVSDGAVATLGTISTLNGGINVDATSTVYIGGNIFAQMFRSTGTVHVHNANLSLNEFSQNGGTFTAVNSVVGGDGVGMGCDNATFTNSAFRGMSFPVLGGNVTFTGAHSGGVNIGDAVRIGSGVVRLRSGATTGNFIRVSSALLDVGAGCSTGILRLAQGGTLRVEPGASVPSLTVEDNSAMVVTVVDGLNLPSTAPITFTSFPTQTASLTVELVNANALRVGDVAPVATDLTGQHVNFGSVLLPSLPGGRALILANTPSGYEVRVVASADAPCWSSDFNGDSDFGTDQDIEAFFACLAGNCCPTCGSADFNSDGDFGTDQDIEAFFRILAGGPC
jgi:hypothetical protein